MSAPRSRRHQRAGGTQQLGTLHAWQGSTHMLTTDYTYRDLTLTPLSKLHSAADREGRKVSPCRSSAALMPPACLDGRGSVDLVNRLEVRSRIRPCARFMSRPCGSDWLAWLFKAETRERIKAEIPTASCGGSPLWPPGSTRKQEPKEGLKCAQVSRSVHVRHNTRWRNRPTPNWWGAVRRVCWRPAPSLDSALWEGEGVKAESSHRSAGERTDCSARPEGMRDAGNAGCRGGASTHTAGRTSRIQHCMYSHCRRGVPRRRSPPVGGRAAAVLANICAPGSPPHPHPPVGSCARLEPT